MMVLWIACASATELLAGPYLQQATPTGVIVAWETDDDAPGAVQFGPTDAMRFTATGLAIPTRVGTTVHHVALEGLPEGSEVYYQLRAGDASSDVHTVQLPTADGDVRMVALSDMQQDAAHPAAWGDIVDDGVLAVATDPLHALLIPGDLVESGSEHGDWTEQFFAQGAPLLASTPLYPVLGNHEEDDDLYYTYMALPGSGTGAKAEGYWTHDVGRVRLIGLDSNSVGTYNDQLAWLDGVLAETCVSNIDFVIAELHHPHHSELWTPGNNPFTGIVADTLGTFSTGCAIPSVHLFGHTHGYSRGAHPEHNHTMMNVASGGGAIDRWGEHPQENYPEFAVSTDDYGFVLLEATTGTEPVLTATRYSRGNPDDPLDNVVRDEVRIRKVNGTPPAPTGLFPTGTVTPDCITFLASDFTDPDGDTHAATQWQVDTDCDDFSEPRLDRYEQVEDRYFDVDLATPLHTELVRHIASERSLCWRVRYRDDGLAWSDWSTPMPFTVTEPSHTENLFRDDDFGPDDIGLGRCGLDQAPPDATVHGLGVCEGQATGRFDVAAGTASYADAIDAGTATAHVSGWFLSEEDDTTTLTLTFLSGDGAVLGTSDAIGSEATTWTEVHRAVPIPSGTRRIDAVLQRDGTVDTASFADGLTLVIGPAEPPVCAEYSAPEVTDERTGCRCTSAVGAPWWGMVVLLGWAARRRRR